MTNAANSDPSVATFLDQVAPLQRQTEARRLMRLFAEVTGYVPRLWAGGIVGFGRYAYTYASGHSGASLATGFAPRKADLSIYIMPGYQDYGDLLARLGRHRLGQSCLYIRHLDAIDEAVLRDLIARGLADLARQWPVLPT